MEHYKEQLNLSDDFFKFCQSKLTNQVKYFLQEDYKDLGFNVKWKLMVPKNLKSHINGGY